MAFRDDHDATLARADALDRENAKLREQAEVQAAELEQLRPLRDRQVGVQPERRSSKVAIGVIVCSVVLIAGIAMLALLQMPDRPHEDTTQPDVVRPVSVPGWGDVTARWHGLHTLLHCRLKRAFFVGGLSGIAVFDPPGMEPLLVVECADELRLAAADDALPAPPRHALVAWQEAEQAFADHVRAGAEPDVARRALERLQAAVVAAGRVAGPALRADVLATVTRRDASIGRDDAYWRTQLHVALDVVGELAEEGADRSQLGPAAQRVRELAGAAPPGIARVLDSVIAELEKLGFEADPAEPVEQLPSLQMQVLLAMMMIAPGTNPPASL